jgi:hypothetical protein
LPLETEPSSKKCPDTAFARIRAELIKQFGASPVT